MSINNARQMPSDEILSRAGQAANGYASHRIGTNIRPCVAAMLADNTLSKHTYPGRDECAFAIACEFAKAGFSERTILNHLESWNSALPMPMSQDNLEKKAAGAIRKRGKYFYSCNHSALSHFCIGEQCQFMPRSKSSWKPYDERLFFRYGWPRRLNLGSRFLYLCIIELEHLYGFAAGSSLYVSFRLMNQVSGMSKATVSTSLEELQNTGLITFLPGRKGGNSKTATEIVRTIPIPVPKTETGKNIN